jgi:PleD family two-component response regulator
MDNVMPEVDGVEATRRIKEIEALSDIPIIMVTASEKIETLQSAFDAGAIDFVKKPFNKIELLARVKSALKLKHEIDERKKAMRKLELLSSLDGLTGIANRRHFDDFLDREWRRSTRDGTPLSLILMDIDFFKKYNDGYGH